MTENREHPGAFEALQRENQRLARQVDHLSILREIALAISGTLELNEVLGIIANVVQGALDVKRLTIYETDKEEGVFRPAAAKYGLDLIGRERLEEDTISLHGSRFGETLKKRTVRMSHDAHLDEAVVPLIAKGEALGVLVLEERRDGEPFQEHDAALLQELGAQIAIAIHNAKLYALAVTDGLTGLFVRRYFDLRMGEALAAARRYGRSFALMMFDIDHFKRFNDTHGHQTGDMVLKQFAKLLQKNTRDTDICCRYGGEEMTVILPETGIDEAAVLANKLCMRIRREEFRGTGEEALSVTASIGVAAFTESYDSPEAMVAAADAALYEAKDLGRNRVELAISIGDG